MTLGMLLRIPRGMLKENIWENASENVLTIASGNALGNILGVDTNSHFFGHILETKWPPVFFYSIGFENK